MVLRWLWLSSDTAPKGHSQASKLDSAWTRRKLRSPGWHPARARGRCQGEGVKGRLGTGQAPRPGAPTDQTRPRPRDRGMRGAGCRRPGGTGARGQSTGRWGVPGHTVWAGAVHLPGGEQVHGHRRVECARRAGEAEATPLGHGAGPAVPRRPGAAPGRGRAAAAAGERAGGRRQAGPGGREGAARSHGAGAAGGGRAGGRCPGSTASPAEQYRQLVVLALLTQSPPAGSEVRAPYRRPRPTAGARRGAPARRPLPARARPAPRDGREVHKDQDWVSRAA